VKISLKNILYGSCSGDYLCFHLASGRKILTLENLGDFVDRLPEESFCLSHRSHFVNLKAIDFGERWRVVIGKT
jgi:DNA-binding LytR/AlgR family response regulator